MSVVLMDSSPSQTAEVSKRCRISYRMRTMKVQTHTLVSFLNLGGLLELQVHILRVVLEYLN